MLGTSVKNELDIIDDIKTRLIIMHNSSFKNEIEKEIPQFVVVGAQSSGKSSVLKMISGIELPTDSRLCTRIPCMIKMRRDKEQTIKVMLNNHNGTQTDFTEDSISQAIEKAQKSALKSDIYNDIQDNEFADKHLIEISIFGNDKANISLIDLPGFTSISTEKSDRIESLVKQYITQPGTLVLHIIKANQDYGSILGNNFMKDNVLGNIVTVLTHCDEENESSKHIPNTLNAITGDIFAVLANSDNVQDEKSKFTKLTYLNQHPSIECGTEYLKKYIEERIKRHMKEQLPKALQKLEEVREEINEEINSIPEVSIELLIKEIDKIKDLWDNKILDYQNYLREKRDEISFSIKNIPIELITHEDDHHERIDESDLEVGTCVYDKIGGDYKKVTITKIKKDLYRYKDEEGNEGTSYNRFYKIDPCNESILKDIQKILSSYVGLRNTVFVDKQKVIEKYAEQFAKNVSNIMFNDNLDKLKEHILITFEDIFKNKKLNVSTEESIDILYKKFKNEFNKLPIELEQSIKNIETYNIGDSVFTTNEHYLTQLICDMMKKNEDKMKDDDSSLFQIKLELDAYLKTQKKVISEVIVKEIIRIYYHKLNELFRKILENSNEKLLEFSKEPEKITRKREILINNQKIINELIEIISRYNIII